MSFYVRVCRICGKLYRVYPDEARGDLTVCRECEEKSDGKNYPNYGKYKQ